MDRYPHTIEVPDARLELDPVSQTARYADGRPIVDARHRATSTGTETSTQTGGGGSQTPGVDHDQGHDSDSD